MPVKFRCPSCDRRLSVSVRKIGTSAKCPNCKQQVVVPDKTTSRHGESEKQESTPRSTLIPAIPQKQTAAVDQSTLPETEGVTSTDSSATDSSAGLGFLDSLAYQQAPAVMMDDENQLPANFASSETSSQTTNLSPSLSRQYLLISRKVIYLQGVLIASVALVTFILGYLIGSVHQNNSSTVNGVITVNGQLTFVDRQGKEQPDVGAVIIALPLMKTIDRDSKILLAEISPNVKTPDSGNEALQSIDHLGGSYHKANLEGKFTLVLPQPGEYQIFILSFNASQPAGFQPEDHTGRINEFYEGAYEIIKNYKYLWLEKDLKNGSYISRNFGRSG